MLPMAASGRRPTAGRRASSGEEGVWLQPPADPSTPSVPARGRRRQDPPRTLSGLSRAWRFVPPEPNRGVPGGGALMALVLMLAVVLLLAALALAVTGGSSR